MSTHEFGDEAPNQEQLQKALEALQPLRQELDTGREESQLLLSYFASHGKAPGPFGGTGLVADIVLESTNMIRETSSYLEHMRERDDAVFEMLREGIQHFSALDEKISSIRENSVEMELVSINALTVAVKAGRAGKGLSYLTEQLKLLSSQTFEYTEELNQRGEHLIEHLGELRMAIDSIRLFQRDFCDQFSEEIGAAFTRYQGSVDKIAELLFEFLEPLGHLHEPLERMQTTLLQMRDALPTDPITAMKEDTRQVQKALGNLKDEMVAFVDFVVGDGFDLPGALSQAFDDSVGVMRILMAKIEDSMLMKGRVTTESANIMEQLKQLEEEFSAFYDVTDTFYVIDIVLRIELARQEALRDREESVSELTTITGRIRNDLRDAMRAVREITAKTSNAIRYYSQRLNTQASLVEQIGDSIRNNYDQLLASRDLFSDAIGELPEFAQRLSLHLGNWQAQLARLFHLPPDDGAQEEEQLVPLEEAEELPALEEEVEQPLAELPRVEDEQLSSADEEELLPELPEADDDEIAELLDIDE